MPADPVPPPTPEEAKRCSVTTSVDAEALRCDLTADHANEHGGCDHAGTWWTWTDATPAVPPSEAPTDLGLPWATDGTPRGAPASEAPTAAEGQRRVVLSAQETRRHVQAILDYAAGSDRDALDVAVFMVDTLGLRFAVPVEGGER